MPTDQPSHTSSSQPPAEAYLDRMVEPEYASISSGAIGALVLAGVAVLAFLPLPAYLPLPFTVFRFPILLVLPLVAIPFALAAMRSIRKSEGTRVGLGLAQAALILAVVETLGAAALHGTQQYHEYALQESLVREAETHLQCVLGDRPDDLFTELVANDPEWTKHEQGYRRLWRNVQAYLHQTGGDYFGRRLQQTRIRAPGSAEQGQFTMGVAIHRLRFREGAMDLVFRFHLVGRQWKLVDVSPTGGVMEFPDDNEKPKKRFEE